MEILSKSVGVVVLFLMLIVYGAFVDGFVIMKFYYWFLKPTVPSLPNFAFMQCVAISMFLVSVKKTSSSNIKDEYKKDTTHTTISAMMMPWFILAVGWFIKVLFF